MSSHYTMSVVPQHATRDERLCDLTHVGHAEGIWRPVRESNPCRRRGREAILQEFKGILRHG